MSTGIQYLMLALAAYDERKFTEAGALFAQAAEYGVRDSLSQTSISSESSGDETSMRDVVSPSRVARIIAASMEATAADEEMEDSDVDEVEDEELDVETDPDIPGEAYVPASFSAESSDGEFEFVVSSPITIRQ